MGLDAHERPRDALRTQKTRAKKWPLRGAAKFREETPRKGGGFAMGDRDTALQQYEEIPLCPQGTKYNNSRQNAAEILEKPVTIAPDFGCSAVRFITLCAAIIGKIPERGIFITLSYWRNKRVVRVSYPLG